jgi:hypothetical protein
MADPRQLRERAELFRRVARRTTRGGKVRPSAYLLARADQYDREADLADARARAGDKPTATQPSGPPERDDRGKPAGGYEGVEPGQRYRLVRSSFSIWEVVEVTNTPGQLVPDVRLTRVGWPKTFTTVPLSVLRDRRQYEPA